MGRIIWLVVHILVRSVCLSWPSACTDPSVKPDAPYWLVATDLDGTLLDGDYDHSGAADAIDTLSRKHNARVVLASSKTLIEMSDIADRCDSRPLLLFENGAGMAWQLEQLNRQGSRENHGYQVENSGSTFDYLSLRECLQSLRQRHDFRFRGFGDLSADEVANMTGLSVEGAALAKQRLYTEPLVWDDSEERLVVFRTLIEDNDLRLVAGGRFLHVMPQIDKADALARLRELLAENYGDAQGLIACGDAENDLGMLQVADLAVIFPDPDGGYLLPESASVRHACMAGPAAWLTSLNRLLTTASVTNQRTTP